MKNILLKNKLIFSNSSILEKIISIIYILMSISGIAIFIYGMILSISNPNNFYESGQIMFKAFFLFLSSLIPLITNNLFKVKFSTLLDICLILFLLGSLLFGEILHFYILFPIWDDMLHIFSGILITIMAINILLYLNDKISCNIMIIFILSILISLSIEYIWELIEFAIDGVSNVNMQTYIDDQTGIELVGRMAIIDTMIDMLENFLGSLFAITISIIDIKKDKKILSLFKINNVNIYYNKEGGNNH